MKIYNSLSRKKEQFVPIKAPKVTMYACGLTPQNHPHLGHAVAAIRFSIIRRYLAYKGYEVIFVENATDIDDKIIERSKELKIRPDEVSTLFLAEYKQSLSKLHIPLPTHYPKVTEYISEIIKYIAELIEQGFAYVTPEGDVYFDVAKKTDYGKLSGRVTKELKVGTRKSVETNKINPQDFALWKKDETVDASWPSPWGKGRPGWHIECSVMSNHLLGNTIDIHCGGLDLIFPHHENEIAQCEAHNNVQFVNYWVHCGLLEINGSKMSKSLGNFMTIDDALDKYGKELIMFAILRHHYRSPIDFNDKLFADNLNALCEYYRSIPEDVFSMDKEAITETETIKNLVKEFELAMDDDFNTPAALVILSNYLSKSRQLINNADKEGRTIQQKIVELGRVIGLFDDSYSLERLQKECLKFNQSVLKIDAPLSLTEIEQMIDERSTARKEKQFAKSDDLRKQLETYGVNVMDSDSKHSWQFIQTSKLN